MAYINQPFDLRMIMSDLDQRLRKLETAQRLTAPNVAFATSTPTNPRIGDMYYDTDADLLKYWGGAAWYEIADNHLSITRQSYTPTWSGTGLAYTGTPATGTYVRIGKMITFNIKVLCTTVTNFGSGGYFLTLPIAPFNNFVFRNGGVHDTSANNHYSILGDSSASSTSIELLYSKSQGSHVEDSPFKQGSPLTLATADFFYLSGTYFIA